MRKRLFVLLIALSVAILMQACVQQLKMKISGNSMLPALSKGVQVTVDKKAYEKNEPQRGDIIAFKDDKGITLIKRVIGLPGETLEIKDGKVYIDGAELEEPYLYEQETKTSVNTSWSISRNYIFVMGDNRGASADSRNFGTVPIKSIIGKVVP